MADPGSVNMAAYRRGVDYLMRNREADGSWHVRTARVRIPAVFRERISARPRSVDLDGGDRLVGHGADAEGNAVNSLSR